MRLIHRPEAEARTRRRGRWPRMLGALTAFALVGALSGLQATAAAASTSGRIGARVGSRSVQPLARTHLRPVIRNAVRHDTSPPLRKMKPVRQPPGKKIKVLPLLMPPHPKVNLKAIKNEPVTAGRTSRAGPAAQPRTADIQRGTLTDSMPSFQQNFEGVGNLNGVLPPDTEGAVGPNDYVQMINLSFAVYNKQGTLLYGPVPNTTLWQGFGGVCQSVNGGDPVVMYDESANRWFMSQLGDAGGSAGFHECIAVSQTGDPTGAWFRYDFLFSSNTLNDYPKFGIWPDAYYMSANDFLNAASFDGVTVVAFDRAQMLAGQPAQDVSFTIGSQYESLLPSNAEGGALGFNPPSGAPDPYFMSCDAANGGPCTSDQIDMWNFHVDWSNPANSTFGNNGAPSQTFPTAPFNSNLCNFTRNCIPQPGTSEGLDALSDRLMYQSAYRNMGGTQAVVLNQTVNVSANPPLTTQAGVRWYELTNNGSGWSMNQQGTYAPDSDNRWMASANIDASGDIAIGYSVSSSSTFPSIRVAGRLAGDPAGQLSQGENSMIVGSGSQTDVQARWGDYSAMQVDPTDGCTFWYTQEYIQNTSDANWQTRIGSFKFPSCTAGPHGQLTGTVTDASTSKPIADATVSTSVGSTTTDSSGHYAMTLAAGSYNVTVSAFGYATQTLTGVQVTDGGTTTQNVALTPTASVTVSGTVTDGSGHGWPLYARLDITGRPGGPVWTNPATGQYSVSLPEDATYAVKVTASLPGYQVVNDSITVGSANVTHNISVPVNPACIAPGYQFNFGTPALSEPFDGTTLPAGWTAVDNNGSGEVWRIGDPENRGNLTGGTGNFADINSDFYGPSASQNTALVSPVVDLSGVANPVLRFHTDYVGFPGQTGDVDVSTDGGATWTNIWHHTVDSVLGPDLEMVAVPQAANQATVQFRYHFTSSFGWWWEVDDVTVQSRSCDPTPGGLVVGTADDANTGAGVNGATISSPDSPGVMTTTMATPDDPSINGGYYQMFVSLTGSHPITATKAPYQLATDTVNVVADSATRANFTLNAGRLAISPPAISATQVLGQTTTTPMTITNTGTAPANFKLDQRTGAFQILTERGSPLRQVDLEGQPASPAWLGSNTNGNQPGTNAGPPADPTWSTIASYPTAIMDNSADFGNGKLYDVGGFDGSALVSTGFVYDPTFNTWSAIASMPQAREKPNVAFVNGKLYVSGGWDTSGTPIAETDAYDPATNTWSAVSPNPHPTTAAGTAVVNGIIYYVGGCADAFCTPSSTVVTYNPSTDTWGTAASYPHTNSWASCGGIGSKLYCAGGTDGSNTFKDAFVYDPSSDSWSPIANMPIDLWASSYGAPNGLLVVSSGVTNGFSTITNQGFAYDPSTDSWTALPNAQFTRYRAAGACGFYKVGGSSGGFSPTPDSELLSGLTNCGVVNIPWLTDTPSSGTLAPGQSVTVNVTLAATTAATVTQPGTYTAQFGVEHNTPYVVNPVNITMNVTPPKGWGKITGTVSGTTCKGVTSPIIGAQVQANSKTFVFSLKTDRMGDYAFWAPAASNPFTLIVSRDGWISQAIQVNVKSQKIQTLNFDLTPTSC